MDLADDALKKGLIAFAMTAKQPNPAGKKDAGNVVALLQEKSATRINNERGGNFSVLRSNHRDGLSLARLSRRPCKVGRCCRGQAGRTCATPAAAPIACDPCT